jgi:hypothetical protein
MIQEVVDINFQSDEKPKYFLTDEEPMNFISREFIQSQLECKEDHETWCCLLHREDINDLKLDIERRYCNVYINSAGIQDGLRVINTNKVYPDWVSGIESSDNSEDYTHLIYVFKTQ